jgi:hypothetical protein
MHSTADHTVQLLLCIYLFVSGLFNDAVRTSAYTVDIFVTYRVYRTHAVC